MWGIFCDGRLVEGDYEKRAQAQKMCNVLIAAHVSEEALEVFRICEKHPTYPRVHCHECAYEREARQ